MVKWRYDEFFDLLEMPCTVVFFFFLTSVFMIFFYFILFYFIFSSFLFFFFLPSFLITSCKDGILTSGLLDKTEMVPIFTIPHNVTVWFLVGARAPAAPGRGHRQPGRWLPFGLRYPFHSGKNALTLRQRLRWSRSTFPKSGGWGQPCSRRRHLLP